MDVAKTQGDQTAVFNENNLFKSDRLKEDTEHQYQFDDQDIDKYSEKITSQFESKQSQKVNQNKAQQLAMNQGEEDFIGNAEEKQTPLSMEKLNLFGVPLSEIDSLGSDDGNQSIKEKNAKRRFVRDLIQVMETIDEQADADGLGLV